MIKIAFALFLAALLLLLIGESLAALHLPGFTQAFYRLGTFSVLMSFALLFAMLALHAGRQLAANIGAYWSGVERQRRRLWFTQGRLENEKRLFFHRRLQSHYVLESGKRRLARANDRKQSRFMARTIERDLAAVKSRVPVEQLKNWRRQNRTYRRQADIEGLIALHQTILSHR